MALLVVEDVATAGDIASVITYLSEVLASGNAEAFCAEDTVRLSRAQSAPSVGDIETLVDLYGDDDCFEPDHRDGCSCQADGAAMDARQLALFDLPHQAGPVPYVPCPQRGTHERLAECWMCFSDIQRGAINLADVLAPAPLAWHE